MGHPPRSGTAGGAGDAAPDLTHEPDLGYIFYPHAVADHPGHPRLDVIIRSEPTERHFDPQKAQFHMLSTTGDLAQITIHHPWSLGQRYRVCPGLIALTDRLGKCVEAFSFGGDLYIQSGQDKTVGALLSTAPIFPLFTPLDLPMWIVSQVEILLAEQEAHWDRSRHHAFKARLGEVDPFFIYACCLHLLYNKGDQIHCGDEELDRQGLQFIAAEIERMKDKGAWPLRLPALDQLCF